LTSDRTYRLISISASGCESLPVYVSVTVLPDVVLALIRSSDTLCSEGSYDLTSLLPVIPSGYNVIYKKGGIIVADPEHITQGGLYTITLQNGACYSNSAEFTLIVNDLKDIHIIGTDLCINSSHKFEMRAYNGATMQVLPALWYSSDSLVASVNAATGEVAAHSTGTFTVTAHYTTVAGCTGEVTSAVYRVNSLPTVITNNLTVCAGTEVAANALVNQILNGDNYKVWSDSTGGNELTGSIIANNTKTYYVEPISTTATCVGLRVPAVITVIDIPVLTVRPLDSVCLGNAYDLRTAITSAIPANATVYYALYGENETLNPFAILTENHPHVYSIRVITNDYRCASQPQFVELRPNPQDVHIIGEHLCINGTDRFRVGSFHNTVVLASNWFSSDSAVASINAQTGEVTAHSVGTFHVTCHYETSEGCYGELVSDVYNVYPLPTVMEKNVTVCAGTEVQTSSLVDYILNGDMYRVYDTVVGGNDVGASFIATATDTLYIEPIYTYGHCNGFRQPVIVRVVSEPTFDLTQNEVMACANGAIDLASFVTNVNIENYRVVVYENYASTPLPTTVVTPAASTYYRVRVVSNTVSDCMSADSLVHVVIGQQQYVALTVNSTTLCAGTAEIISALPAGTNGTYQWRSSNNTIAEIVPFNSDSATVHALSEGTVTITYDYEATSGCQGHGEKVITVKPLPILTNVNNGMTVCEGVTTLFSELATVHAGQKLNVYQNDTLQTTDRFTATTDVTYKVEAEDLLTGCTGPRRSVFVDVIGKPIINVTPKSEVCELASVDLTSLVLGVTVDSVPVTNYTLRFTDNNGNAIVNPVTPSATTIYRIYALAGNCESQVSLVTVTVKPKPLLIGKPLAQVCQNTAIDLLEGVDTIHLGSNFTIKFYADANLTLPVNRILIPQQNTYYAQATVANCKSDAVAVKVNVRDNVVPTIQGVASTAICQNSTYSYHTEMAANITNYLWRVTGGTINGSDTNSSVNITWNNAGQGILTVSYDKDGCHGISNPQYFNVEPAPVATLVNPATTVCGGSTITYTAQNGAATYQWTISAAASYTTNGNMATVTWNNAGTGTIQVIATSAAGCSATSTVATVTIKPVVTPTFVLPQVDVCAGDTVQYTIFPSGSYTYYWRFTGGNVVAGGTPTDNTITLKWGAGSSGSLFATVIDSAGCVPATPITATVHINSLPNVTVTNPVVCHGGSLLLSNLAASTGNTLRFFSDANAVTELLDIDLENLTSTMFYYVYAENSAGCRSAIKQGRITVRAEVVFNITKTSDSICAGNTYNLVSLLQGNIGSNTIIYSYGGSMVRNPQAVSQAGTYTLVMTNSLGCASATRTFELIVNKVPTLAITGESSFCANTTLNTLRVTLTPDNIAGTGQWSVSSGSAATIDTNTGKLTGISAGTVQATYTYTTDAGCVVSAVSAKMLVSGVPEINDTLAIDPVCEGNLLQVHVPTVNWNGTQPIEGVWLLNNYAFDPFVTPVTMADSGKRLQYQLNSICGAITGKGLIVNVMRKPQMAQISDIIYCHGETTPVISLGNESGITYQWTQTGNNIGLNVTSGINEIPSFVAANTGYTPLTANIKVTAFNGICNGNSVSFTIMVNPMVRMTSPAQIDKLCSESVFDYFVTCNNSNAMISWSRASTAGINNGATSSGQGAHIQELLVNNTDSAIRVTYEVSFALGNCTNKATVTVTVQPVPQISIAPSVDLCMNSNEIVIPYTLSAAQQGMTFYYTITFDEAAIYAGFTNISHHLLSGNKIIISAPASLGVGAYSGTLTVQAANGCWNVTPMRFIINRVGLPTIVEQPQSVTICDTTAFSLSVTATGGSLTYQWFKNGTPISGATNPVYLIEYPDSSSYGNYYVVVSGTCGIVISETVTVQRNPVMLLTKWKDVIFVSNVNNNYVAYQWYKDGVPIGFNGNYQSYVQNGGLNGTYSVKVTYIDGTTVMSCPYTVNLASAKSAIMVYPNPTVPDGEIVIDLSGIFERSVDARGTKLEFYDMSGRLIQTDHMDTPIQSLPLKVNSCGVYMLRISTLDHRIFIEKIIVN
jgi:hypothetical protein